MQNDGGIVQLAIALLAISAGSIILKFGGNEGGEAGHLGGAIIGAILMRWPQLISGRHASGAPRRNTPAERKIQPRTTIDLQRDSEVDLILDSGRTRIKPGQIVIQRGTSHGWEAVGAPALLLAVLIDRPLVAPPH